MRYRVSFEKRLRSDGQDSPLDTVIDLDENLPDGIVAEKTFVEYLEPPAQHSQEVLDEDDAFLALAGTEVWEYEIPDARAAEFEDAVRNAGSIFEITVIEDAGTTADDVTTVRLATDDRPLGDAQDDPRNADGDPAGDGPAGVTVGDPSAGGQPSARARRADPDLRDHVDDLSIADADDPRLGITASNDARNDWAADTGPTREASRSAETTDLTDRSSTLRPRPPRRKSPAKP